MIPQIRSTLTMVLTILIGVPVFTVFQLWTLGEISPMHPWQDASRIVAHSFFGTVMLAVGWIFFKSPFASKLTEIVQASTATSSKGVVTQTETKVSITEPIGAIEPVVVQTDKKP